MTGNKEKLDDFVKIVGGTVTFGGGDGKITGKGTIRTSKLNFENVYYVEELQNFNLFSVSQICDTKNKFQEGTILSLLHLSDIQPERDVTCLLAKASLEESTKWHRRMAHVNFKNMNKLAKHGLLLHMDLFGPTSIRSIDHKYYSLVVTDDFSRFTWVFFLGTKDETYGILKDFITFIENQLTKQVKAIRCDNGTEFKNSKLIELCGSKGIRRDYSNARTPQQNGVAERKNRTLIEAARTMLADSMLPTMFWTEAVSTACYVNIVSKLLTPAVLKDTPNMTLQFYSDDQIRSVMNSIHIMQSRKVVPAGKGVFRAWLDCFLLSAGPSQTSTLFCTPFHKLLHHHFPPGHSMGSSALLTRSSFPF
ncbi:putative ribonuclease H-like domain-containing protein [Tanacetum coccineum]